MPHEPSGSSSPPLPAPRKWSQDLLDFVERLGNRLPDPVVLFLVVLVMSWVASAVMAPISLLGVGVAEHTGFINANLKALLRITPAALLTPMVLLVSVLSHTAGDSAYVLIIPLGGVIYYTAGRHPLAGLAAAFAGVSGGFSANIIPSALDPLLQGFTQSAAQIIDPARTVNPLCNWGFSAASGVLLVFVGWYLTDFVIEPRLAKVTVDGDPQDMPSLTPLTRDEFKGMLAGLASAVIGIGLLVWAAWPSDSPLRAPSDQHELTTSAAPLMKSVVPLIFLLFLVPGIVYGYVAGTVRSHHDIVKGMTKSMGAMGYYLVLAFFASQFTAVFRDSNVGALMAIKGALFLKSLNMPAEITIVGIVVISALLDVLIGSASAKWALMGLILVPMLMQVGISPELTQAAYRIGDSTTNIVSPLMPYFPLIVVYCQRYVKSTGIGTLAAIMLPYSLTFLCFWTGFLLVFWKLGIPLGLDASYTYPP